MMFFKHKTRVIAWLSAIGAVAVLAGAVATAPILVTEAANEEPVREERAGLNRVHSVHVSSYSHAHVRLEWSSQYPMVRWRVERSNGPMMDNDTRVTLATGNGENFTYTDEAVVPETQYTYRAVVNFRDPGNNNQLTESMDDVTFTTTAAPSTDRVIGGGGDRDLQRPSGPPYSGSGLQGRPPRRPGLHGLLPLSARGGKQMDNRQRGGQRV